MSRTFSLLILIGFLVLVLTPSLARDLKEDALVSSNINETNEVDEMLWNIESLKHRHHCNCRHQSRHAPSPQCHGAPRIHRYLPPPT